MLVTYPCCVSIYEPRFDILVLDVLHLGKELPVVETAQRAGIRREHRGNQNQPDFLTKSDLKMVEIKGDLCMSDIIFIVAGKTAFLVRVRLPLGIPILSHYLGGGDQMRDIAAAIILGLCGSVYGADTEDNFTAKKMRFAALFQQDQTIVTVAAVFSVFSFIGSSFIVFMYLRHPKLRSLMFRLVVWISVSDIISSLGLLFGTALPHELTHFLLYAFRLRVGPWLRAHPRISSLLPGNPSDGSGACYAQAVLTQLFQIASMLWTVAVALVADYWKIHAVVWGSKLMECMSKLDLRLDDNNDDSDNDDDGDINVSDGDDDGDDSSASGARRELHLRVAVYSLRQLLFMQEEEYGEDNDDPVMFDLYVLLDGDGVAVCVLLHSSLVHRRVQPEGILGGEKSSKAGSADGLAKLLTTAKDSTNDNTSRGKHSGGAMIDELSVQRRVSF
eukprot:jgi/Bigna1/82070/fgenesh1_pg.87_\